MEDSFEYIMDIIFTLIVIMFSITFTISVFSLESRYNDALVEDIGQKASSRFTMGTYGDRHVYFTPADAYVDITAGDPAVLIQVNGSYLSADVLDKAQNNDPVAVRAIRNALTHTKYRKVPTYSSDGTLLSINYIGE